LGHPGILERKEKQGQAAFMNDVLKTTYFSFVIFRSRKLDGIFFSLLLGSFFQTFFLIFGLASFNFT